MDYGAMLVEGRQLKEIGIPNATSSGNTDRTGWNPTKATSGRVTATWEVIMGSIR